jgi:hypothetical protein
MWRHMWRNCLGYMIFILLITSNLGRSPPSDMVSFLPCPAHRPARPAGADKGLQPFGPRDKASRYIAIAWSCRCRT